MECWLLSLDVHDVKSIELRLSEDRKITLHLAIYIFDVAN